jgi:effector-binding domain-containing protein
MRAEIVDGASTTPGIVELPARETAVVHIEGATVDLPRLFAEAFELSARAISTSGARIAGPPYGRYYEFGARIRAEAGFPFAGTVAPTERVSISTLPAGRAVTITHVGSYETLGETWQRGQTYLSAQGLTATGAPWECYLTGPDDPGPPVTEVFWPVRAATPAMSHG